MATSTPPTSTLPEPRSAGGPHALSFPLWCSFVMCLRSANLELNQARTQRTTGAGTIEHLDEGELKMTPKRHAVVLIGLLAGVLATFVLGRTFRTSSEQRQQGQPGGVLPVDQPDRTAVHRRSASHGSRRALLPPLTSSNPQSADQPIASGLRATAARTVEALLAQVDTPGADSNPEGTSNIEHQSLGLSGWHALHLRQQRQSAL